MSGMFVRRSDMACLSHRWSDVTLETQHFEKEQSNPVWTFAQLHRLRFGLVTVSHANLVGLIRVACASSHAPNATGGRVLSSVSFGSLPGALLAGIDPRSWSRMDP
jgi:hypothetical protein